MVNDFSCDFLGCKSVFELSSERVELGISVTMLFCSVCMVADSQRHAREPTFNQVCASCTNILHLIS